MHIMEAHNRLSKLVEDPCLVVDDRVIPVHINCEELYRG